MKKLISGIIAAALVVAIGTTSALAAGPAKGFGAIDADGDGICDRRGTSASCRFIDEDGDGICDYVGMGRGKANDAHKNGRGNGYVDSDGDGVCDNRGTGGGAGCGNGYVDSNGDGVCDNYGTGSGAHDGTGRQNGNCGGNR